MQKKLIALAVAGLVSVPAFAQSNVTIYGVADMNVAYRSDNITKGVESQAALNSGGLNGSRLGFKGTEALGNGLTAGFVLEQGLNIDNGTAHDKERSFSRQSFMTLAGNFGTVALGRQYTPQHLLFSSYDPFGQGTVGQNANIWKQGSLGYTSRLDNLAAYISPSFAGFNVVVGYSFNAGLAAPGVESPGNDEDTQVWAINPNYKNGPIAVGLNYHEARAKSATVANRAEYQVLDLLASYDFGVAKLAAAYGQSEKDGADDKTKKFMVGVTVPVSASGNLLASYNQASQDGIGAAQDNKAKQWAVGYIHNLSKRTAVYTAYADISNDGLFKAEVGDSSADGGDYQRGFNLGLRHNF
jgi:predicted porin